eukprot:TRINITY_DN21529_c0_g3_i1.p1 TRINITY_DN21529_c0_g3~~TRINITY_DN21529_c0_g3_i1.p1  ORF type:complete len:1083 (-),score=317.31 TRINITY_DN21529_c0_g3_i1:169-3417(-)
MAQRGTSAKKRADVEDPLTKKPRIETPSSDKKRSIESPASLAKAAKLHDSSNIADKIANVASATDHADGRSDQCKHMLHNLTPTSLGTPVSRRSSDQKQATHIVGKALRAMNKALSDKVAQKEKDLALASDKCRRAESKKLGADTTLKDAKDDLDRRQEACRRAEGICQIKNDASDKAKDAHDKALGELEAAIQERQALDDLYKNHFLPLKAGCSQTEATSHLYALEGPLREWGCEDCLFAGFKEAGYTTPSKRGPHCRSTVDSTEQLFNKPKRDADAKVSKAKDVADKAGGDAARAAKDADDAARGRAAAEAKLPPSEKAHREAQDAADEAERLAQDARSDVEIKTRDVDDAKKDADDFRKGPMSDYDALLKHDISGYDPALLPKAGGVNEDAKDPKDKKRVTVAQDEVADCPGVDKKTKKMLSDMAPGCLGPKKNARDDLQKEAVEMLKNRLNDNLNDLEDDIDDLAAGAYQSDAALAAGKKAADKAKASGRNPEEVAKTAANLAKKAGGSSSVCAKAAADAAAAAAIDKGKSPDEVAKAAAKAAKAAGGSPDDIVDAAADAAARAAIRARLSPAEAGRIAAEAVKAAGGSPADAAKAAAKAAAKVAKANGDDPAEVAKKAARAAEAAGASPSAAAKLAGQAAGDAALADGKSPEEAVKDATDACKAAGCSPEATAKVAALTKEKAEGKDAADDVLKKGDMAPDAAKAGGRAAADAAKDDGKSPVEQSKAAADAAKGAGGSPSDAAKAAAERAADAAIAAGKSPAEVAKVAADAFRAAGGSPEDLPRVAGNAAGKAARAAGKSPAEVGKAAADAAKAFGGTPSDAAAAAGRQAGKAAEEAGLSADEVGKAAGDAAKAAGGSPKDITKAINQAKLADALKNDPDQAPGIADTIAKNRRNDVDDAEKRCKEACEDGCKKADDALENAKYDLKHAEQAHEEIEDAYTNHFLPLKNGAGSPEEHLNALKPLLDEYNCDPCLKAAFCVSALHKPNERQEWCSKCVNEIDRFFATPRKLALDKISSARAALRKAERDSENAHKSCEDAMIALLRAKEELKTAERLKIKVAKLNAKKALQADIHEEE